MTKNIDWGLVALGFFLSLLFLGALISDSSDWTPISGDCVLNVETDRRLLAQPETDRQIYCATEEVR